MGEGGGAGQGGPSWSPVGWGGGTLRSIRSGHPLAFLLARLTLPVVAPPLPDVDGVCCK